MCWVDVRWMQLVWDIEGDRQCGWQCMLMLRAVGNYIMWERQWWVEVIPIKGKEGSGNKMIWEAGWRNINKCNLGNMKNIEMDGKNCISMPLFYLHKLVVLDPILQWVTAHRRYMLNLDYRSSQTQLHIQKSRRCHIRYCLCMLLSHCLLDLTELRMWFLICTKQINE